MEKLNKENETEQCAIPSIIGSIGENKLSMCCGVDVHLEDTTNGIKCYCCNNCNNLTGVINNRGERVN